MKFKFLAVAFVFSLTISAQQNQVTLDYIERYKDIAIGEMKSFGIPASITLAQGILESGNGLSELAQKSNNHFGIKCHLEWKGKKTYHDDDKKGECFRVYDDPEESFIDHSKFLAERSRYSFLFEYKPTDYRSWAKGLKKAGYATNKKYPQLLIDLIERYDLHKYDLAKEEVLVSRESAIIQASDISLSANKVKYIVAAAGDTYESIGLETEKTVDEILKYNEISYDTPLREGQLLYLQTKRKKGSKDVPTYKVQSGQDMYWVSQKFAIRLDRLYKLNNMPAGTQAKVGQVLKLR